MTEPGEPLSPEEALAFVDAAVDVHTRAAERWSGRWRSLLVLGNGGGTLGVSAILLAETVWRDALLASAWCFVCGTFTAGILPLFLMWFATRQRDAATAIRNLLKSRDRTLTKERTQKLDAATKFEWVKVWAPRLELASAAMFMAGVLIPLVSLTFFA